jgi:predicted metalloprotease with PDZ domain
VRAVVQKIVETELFLFCDIPHHDYYFASASEQFMRTEHLNSTALGFRRNGFERKKATAVSGRWSRMNSFHLWNVKRISPTVSAHWSTRKKITRVRCGWPKELPVTTAT